MRAARLALVLLLAGYGLAMLRNPGDGWLMDAVDLPIHETGHLVFAAFGETLAILGGTILQLLFPLVFAGYFLRRGDLLGGGASLWWTGQSCWNVSVYAADARTEELPLVGGGEHDWATFLGDHGWLRHDHQIARVFWSVGVLLYLTGLALAATGALRPAPVAAAAD